MNYINRFITALKGPRIGPSPSMRLFYEKYGSYTIINMNVCRAPIKKYIEQAAEIITLGQYNKKKRELHYDKLFHLYLLLTLQNNDNSLNVRFEKNEVVQITQVISLNDIDCLNISLNKEITFNEFIYNTINEIGLNNFYLYDSVENNCQKFIIQLLITNQLGNKKIYDFIEQDVKNLVVLPVQKIAHFVTDIAARLDVIKYGASLI